jgi:GDPmannose 4,6-dehydratase
VKDLGRFVKKVLITGITGQDGHHLAKLLLSKNYEVFGLVNGQRNSREESFTKLFPAVTLLRGDLQDFSSLVHAVENQPFDEIYNLGAISFVGLSFKQPEITANVTGLGALRLLEAIRTVGLAKTVRFYQASSSEMFGKVREVPQTELTPFYPRSPYGVAKAFAHQICVNYRESYGMHISCGILFNHEGEFRGKEFVTRKITSGLAEIIRGSKAKIKLGSLKPSRDWGYAGDYVNAMWLMTQQEVPDDYIIATGETHTVEEFARKALFYAGLGEDLEKYIEFDVNELRPAEVDLLIGDASKAITNLGWKPTLSFDQLVELMVKNDLQNL